MSDACFEIVWLHGILSKLGFSQPNPTSLYTNNTSAIQIAANHVDHERTKHVEVDCHSIQGSLRLSYYFSSLYFYYPPDS